MNKLESFRTTLRRPLISDYTFLQELEGDGYVVQYTPMRIPQTEEQTKTRLANQLENQNVLEPYGVWLAHLKSDGSFLGWFMLMPAAGDPGAETKELELGFMIVRKHWNKGFTSEVARRLIDGVKQNSSIKSLIAKTDLNNLASIRTLEKLGFRYVETRIVPERYFPGEFPIKIFSLEL